MSAAAQPDIFDQVLGDTPSQGDIFDQVLGAAEPPKKYLPEVEKAIASVPKPTLNIPTSTHLVQTSPYMPGAPARFEEAGEGETPASVATTEASRAGVGAGFGAGGYPKIVSGAKKIADSGAMPGSSYYTPPQVLPTPEELKQREAGTAEFVGGVGEAATPFLAEGIAARPLQAAVGIGTGYLASKGAKKGVELAGGGPEAQRMAEELGFWAPTLAGALFEPKGRVDISPEGTRATGTILGGKAGAGVAITPEGVTIRGKVGPLEGSKTFGRGQPTGPGLEPPTIEGNAPPPPSDDPAITSMVASRDAEVASAKQAAGIPPPVPPAPPRVVDQANAPAELKKGHIPQKLVDSFETVIEALPENLRSQAIQEAHKTLTQVLIEGSQHGPMVGPDGKLIQVDEGSAPKVALKLINDAISAHDKVSAAALGEARGGKAEAVPAQAASAISSEKATGDIFDQVLGEAEKPSQEAKLEAQGALPGGSGAPAVGTETQSPVGNKESAQETGTQKNEAVVSAEQPTPLKKGDQAVLAKDTVVGEKTLPAGSRVTIQYVHPKGMLVRATAEDGTKFSRGMGAFKGVQSQTEKIPQSAPKEATPTGSRPPEPVGTTEPPESKTPTESNTFPQAAPKLAEPEHPSLELGQHAEHTEMLPTQVVAKYRNSHVQMVPTKELEKYREFDRRAEGHDERIDALKADIKKNGLKEPMVLKYGSEDKKAHLWDGNHRLDAALELGLKELPAMVITGKKTDNGYGVAVPGHKGEVVPPALKPSEIGLEGRAVKTETPAEKADREHGPLVIKTIHGTTEKLTPKESPVGEGKGAELLAQAVYEKLKAGESLGNVTNLNELAEQHFGAARTSGTWTPKDAFDAMEAGVNKYLLDAGKELMEMPAIEGLAQLRELMPRITSQGVRTEEQIKNQQFSTPPTESYVAAKVAGLKPSDIVLEPSAGNGGLAVWPKAIGAEVHVNEVAPRRQEMLELAGFGKPSAHDGEIINSLLDPKIKPTVVLMNPPFSASTQKSFETKNRNQYGFNHVDSALQRLEDGGRLVAILGGGQANEPNGGASLTAGSSGKWFEKIGDKYNVRANVRINGKEYQKYGTSFATRLIVIDKDGPTPSRIAPGAVKSWESVVQKNVDTLEEAYNALKDVAESRPEVSVEPGRPKTVGQVEPGTGVVPSGSAGAAGDRVPVRSEREASAGDELSSRPDGPLGSVGGNGTDAGSERTTVREPETGPAKHPETKASGSAESRPENADVKRPLSGTETSDPALELGRENSKLVKREEEDSSAYVAYRPTLKGPAHPANIVETRTMATVPLPEITYKPSLPESVVKDGKLSAVQLEAISIAGQQNDIVLPDGSRATALIGDGTGVGKGRIGAGVLWDNYRKGRKRLVWVSEKWDLMQDAIRDLQGIGAHDLAKTIKPFGKISASTPIDHEGILFSTYALIRSEDKKGNSRVNQLQQWLKGKDEANGAYILYDESHNLKNAVAATAQTVSQIGAAVKKMMADTPNLRSVSLSATAATDVINLGYLDRLGLWGAGTPFPNGFGEFQAQIASGGMSAMEMVARELKAQGKYVSRTLSYKGVTYEEIEHVLTEEQKDLYRTASKAWASVVQQAEDTIKNTTNGGAQAKARFMSLFYGAQLRFFNVLLTTLKIPTAVEEANKALAADKSVVITLVNTNEAAQNREKNRDRGGEDSDEIPDYDFGPGEMLKDLVREHYPTQQFIDDVDSEGNPIKVPAYRTDEEGRKVPLINPQAVKERDQLIAQLDRDLKMPANPLDILINSLGGPKKVAELTGRKERYDENSGKFVPRGDPNVKRDEINLSEMRAFQGGKKRVAILSSAAGTGISLHAGNDAVNQQKRRHITLQPGWSADKAMQMMGRTHRSNEAHQPEYAMLTSDLGGEKRFTSTLAKRMGSLGALSKGQSNANAGSDLMEKVNFESDQGRQATTAFYNAMLRNVNIPGTKLTGMQVLTDLRVLKLAPGGGGMTVPPADRTNVTRLLNRLLALDPDVQNSVYNYFYDIFQATVQQAVEDGTLDTGVKTLPGDDFSVKEERAISKDPKTGAETFYYPVDAEVRTNRMSTKALDAALKSNKKRNPVIMRNKEGKVSLAMEASPIVHASGSVTPASYIVSPENGNARKVATSSLHGLQPVTEWAEHAQSTAEQAVERAKSEVEYSKRTAERYPAQPWAENRVKESEESLKEKEATLADATKAAADAPQWARDQWEKQHSEAPAHTTKEHHLIGGAVLRWWNPIREAAGGLNIYTALDSKTGKRVVGVDIPQGEIRSLLQRITGGASTVDASQLHTDVLKNGLTYSLEQGIQVRRGRVNRENVVQFIPPNQDIAANLKRMGLIYERGIQPIYYLPNAEGRQESERVAGVLDKILKEYPVKQEAPKEDGLLAGESGELNVSRLGEVVAQFIKQDVAPALEKSGVGLKEVPALFVRALYPRIEESNPVGRALGVAAPADAVDALMKVQGDRAKNLGEFDLILKGVEKMFDRLPENERIDFIDRIQNGEDQPTPDLLDLASMFKKIMEAQRDAEEEAANLNRPDSISANNKSPIELSRKKNYFHNWWETPPGKESADDESDRISRQFMPRRPLEGTKGYNKKQSYTLRSGIEAGGEPVTTNPVRILRHRLEDGMKFITARRSWYELKELGLRQYVKKGAPKPAGFDKVDDKIAKVWFPAALDFGGKEMTAPHELGEWYVEANTARLLNNMLSVDKIRGNALGRGLMWLKNSGTAIELGISPFHLVFSGIEAQSSQLSLGMLRAYNLGVRQGSLTELAKGVMDMASAGVAPITLAHEGAALPAYIEARARLGKIGLTEYGHVISGDQPHGVLEAIQQFREVRKEKNVQALIKRYPDLDQLVDDMFQGGLVVGQHRDYQVKAFGKTAAEAWTAGNPIGAVLRSIPTILQGAMHPLFNVYIPNLKYSLFLRMMSEQAAEHASELEDGSLTRATLARRVADSVENRFGELNFDNLFLNRTTKTALQFIFRSATYKLGTAREFVGAAGGQTRELGQWAKDAYDLLGGEKEGTEETHKTVGEKALPKLDARASWVAALMFTTAVLGTIAAKLYSKKYPWQWVEEDKKEGMNLAHALLLETTHPRTGETDSRGKPVRISLPTYWKDVEHAMASPGNYVLSSLSTLLSRALDTAENRDYFKNYVYNPNAPLGTKLRQIGWYNTPSSFGVSNFERAEQQGLNRTAWLSAFGFPKAPSDLDFTPAEKMARDIIKANEKPATPEELEAWREKHQAFVDGKLPYSQAKAFMKRARESMLQRQLKNSAVSYADARKIFEAGNPEEKKSLERIMMEKRARLMRERRGSEVKAAEAQ